MIVGFCEFFQSLSPGAVETEIMEASEIPKDVMKGLKSTPFLKSKDIADSVIHVLGTPPHVQVGTQYFNMQSDFILPLHIIFNLEKENKIKLLTEFVGVTPRVLLLIEAMLQNAKPLQHGRFSWHIRHRSFLGSSNTLLRSVRPSRSPSVQNTTRFSKLL
jgi:hypothetical protein